ncbi:MAG: hypothetical protein ACYC6T_16880 [Thermoleophilia bacterium]
MAELKTQPTGADVETFLNRVTDEHMRADSFAILELMREVTQAEPTMWGESIVGKSCLYVRRLSDIHPPTLRTLIERSVAHVAGEHRGS